MDYHRIGKRIQIRRKQCGYTQERLAEAANLSASYLSHIERGSKKTSLESLSRLATALDTSVDWLLTGGSPLGKGSSISSETQELMEDCSAQEQRILMEATTALKQILRNNR